MNWQLEGIEDGTFAERLVEQKLDWILPMEGCPQDPFHHAEGDVLTHVLWVCRELVNLPDFQSLDDQAKQILAWSALLHDVAKPRCTVYKQGGRIGSPHHAPKGAIQARRILWALDCPFEIREQICALVLYHMPIFHAFKRSDPNRFAREVSLRCRCDHLAILAEADARGRECRDQNDLLERVELFKELAIESGCLDRPAEFASNYGRFRYFQGKWHNPELAPFEDVRSKVIVMSGLPGTGKDHWITNSAPNWPVVSLDYIRQVLGISPQDHQGRVIDEAREQARVHLRAKRDFIWNATNISRRIRDKSLSLFLEYGARIEVVYVETDIRTLESQNRNREHQVPWKAIERMLGKWDPPSLTEAHKVRYLVGS